MLHYVKLCYISSRYVTLHYIALHRSSGTCNHRQRLDLFLPQNYPPARCGLSATNFVARRVNYPPFAIFSKKDVKIFGSVFNISFLRSVWHHNIEKFATLFSNTQKHAMHCIIYNRKKPVKTVVGKKRGETVFLGMLPNFFHHIQSPSEAVNRELCFAVFLSLP